MAPLPPLARHLPRLRPLSAGRPPARPPARPPTAAIPTLTPSPPLPVHVEETPELLPLLTSDEFADFVHVSHVSSEEDDARPHTGGDGNYNSLMRRQEAQVRRGLREAARDDVDWLFHIDDDELLHFAEPFQALLA